jgi:hypothetical protein
MTLSLAGFTKGKTILSPAIGGSVGNAVNRAGAIIARFDGAGGLPSPGMAKGIESDVWELRE